MSRSIGENTTPLPNVILDVWMPHLTGAEIQIVLHVARQTCGWGKAFDRISLSQMQAATGLARSTVARTCDDLESKGILEVAPAKNRTPAAYRLNLAWRPAGFAEKQTAHYTENATSDYTENATSTENGTVPKIDTTVPIIGTPTVPIIGTTRDKERDTKQETEEPPECAKKHTPAPQGAAARASNNSARASSGIVSDFETFWAAYPLHEAKDPARKAFVKLQPPPELMERILAAITEQRRGDQWQRGIIPHAATWLNQRRWADEPPPAAPVRGPDMGKAAKPAPPSAATVAGRFQRQIRALATATNPQEQIE